jgi:hypothetical protein
VPMSSKSCRWVLVGSVSIVMVIWVPGAADLVAGQRRQVLGQAAGAAVGLPGLVVLV